MCNCANHVRTWDETRGGLPASKHGPNCEDYKEERFQRVAHDGASFIDTPENVAAYLDEADDPDIYEVTDIQMTQDQFEALPEFTGF